MCERNLAIRSGCYVSNQSTIFVASLGQIRPLAEEITQVISGDVPLARWFCQGDLAPGTNGARGRVFPSSQFFGTGSPAIEAGGGRPPLEGEEHRRGEERSGDK